MMEVRYISQAFTGLITIPFYFPPQTSVMFQVSQRGKAECLYIVFGSCDILSAVLYSVHL